MGPVQRDLPPFLTLKKLFFSVTVTSGMELKNLLARQVLDEDLQIVRGTLEAISDDVRYYSDASAIALAQALEKLELAQAEFARTED